MSEFGLQAFCDHVAKLKDKDATGNNGFEREYGKIKQKSTDYLRSGQYSCSIGRLSFNYKKNRYKDILPFDYSRVRLPMLPGVEGSDYINASYLAVGEERCSVIAAMGPLDHTVNDFWRMVWSHNIKVVIMAAKEIEAGKKKCARYWPQVNGSASYGQLKVTHVRVDNSHKPDFVISELRIECEGHSRKLFHFQYLTWPDHGVPSSPTAVMKMLSEARKIQPAEEQWPIIIHCSAGCGRTGALVTVDHVWNMLNHDFLKAKIDIYDIVAEYRKRRQSMVQTLDQYVYVYKAVLDLVKGILQQIEGSSLRSDFISTPAIRERIKTLTKDRARALTLAKNKLTTLEDVKVADGEDEDEESESLGLESANKSKNPVYFPKFSIDDFGNIGFKNRIKDKLMGPRAPTTFVVSNKGPSGSRLY
eukprot:m.16336 g.16336  ORF g.16336 m.16336 type:complete len:418 (-) comp5668_c0_seq1:97-1350(-)